MDEEIRDTIAQGMYEAEKHLHINRSLGGHVIEWETLRDFQKAEWYARVERAVNTYLDLTRTRYVALSEAEIAMRVREHNAAREAGLEQE